MILGFDIGNTSTSMGLYRPEELAPDLVQQYATGKGDKPQALGEKISPLLEDRRIPRDEIEGVAISSVVPELNESYRKVAADLFSVSMLEISNRSKLSVRLGYHDPSQIGADRIVNAEAAFVEYGGGCVVADLGTAVTFTVVDENGLFEGGIIAPGVGTATAALAARASRLPEVPFEKPDALVARDTMNAIKSGVFYGWISLIEGITARIEKERRRSFRLILTGGYSGAIAKHMGRPSIHDPLLTMKGIKLVYDLNQPPGSSRGK